MPAEHHIDNKSQLIITTWVGEARENDLLDAIKKYQKEIQIHPDYIKFNEILDFSNITKIKITTNGIVKISRVASSTDKFRLNRKLAIIVSSNLAFGLARMYETYRGFSSTANKEIRVFKNRNDGLEWATEKKFCYIE